MIQMKTPPFQPGDKILLKRGDRFEGNIVALLRGTPELPIMIGAYGNPTDAKPIIDGNTMGGIPGRTWTAVPGRPGYYYWAGGYAIIIGNNFYEIYNGSSHLMQYRNEMAAGGNRETWLDSLGPGQFGPKNWTDTVWIHTHDSGPMDSVVFARASNWINAGSHDAIIRDLDIRNFNTALGLSSDTNIIIRNISTCNCFGHALMIGLYDYNITIDSCNIDSCGTTAIYLEVSSDCFVRNSSVTNVCANIRGVTLSGDQCGIGIQGRAGNPPTGPQGMNNVVEYNTIRNIIGAAVDFYYNEGDTIRYNTGTNCGGISPHGTRMVVDHNIIALTGVSGANAANITNLGSDTITFTNNTFTNLYGYGLAVAAGNVGPVILFSNTVQGIRSIAQFVWFSTPSLVTSTNNKFCGLGRWLYGAWPNHVIYDSLADFQAATGLEAGSEWHSDCSNSPTGTFTASPDSLPEGGGSVTLEWTSMNATSASISPLIGSVATSGIDSVTIDSTTVFALTLEGSGGTSLYTARVIVGAESPGIGPDTLPKFLRIESYPNPFNTVTTVEVYLPEDTHISLKVFDALGRAIETLAEGRYTRGIHRFLWNAEDMASGVYYYKFTVGSYTETRSMILVR
jgi:hypothetical protein